jgi:hypothetical protein
MEFQRISDGIERHLERWASKYSNRFFEGCPWQLKPN